MSESSGSPQNPNITPESAIEQQVAPIEVNEPQVAFIGLRKFINAARINRAEHATGKIDELLTSGMVRAEAAKASLEGRMPHANLVPVKRTEKYAHRRASRLRTRVMRANMEGSRLAGLYGDRDAYGHVHLPVSDERKYLLNYHTPEAREERKNLAQTEYLPENSGVFSKPPGFDTDLGTQAQRDRLSSGRYPKSWEKDEKKTAYLMLPSDSAAEKLKHQAKKMVGATDFLGRSNRKADKFGRRIKKMIEGKDLTGVYLRKRAEHLQKKVDRLPLLRQRQEELQSQAEAKRHRRQAHRAEKASRQNGEE